MGIIHTPVINPLEFLFFSVWEPFLCTYKYMYSIIIEYNWNLR